MTDARTHAQRNGMKHQTFKTIKENWISVHVLLRCKYRARQRQREWSITSTSHNKIVRNTRNSILQFLTQSKRRNRAAIADTETTHGAQKSNLKSIWVVQRECDACLIVCSSRGWTQSMQQDVKRRPLRWSFCAMGWLFMRITCTTKILHSEYSLNSPSRYIPSITCILSWWINTIPI